MMGEKTIGAVRAYLKYLKVERFGGMSQRTIGPFGEGLNVVFGKNEAGKTTLFTFVDGVLFGWREARGARNTYKPEGAERVGALLFAERMGATDETAEHAHAPESSQPTETALREEDGEGSDQARVYELRRVKNVDGLQGETELVEDIDVDTFRTMFALTSDELRSLRNTSDITAKLLTAGSGTGSSPAQALGILQDKLAECTSRAAGAEHSIVRLSAERDAIKEDLDAAAAEAEEYRKHHHELHDLRTERDDLALRMQQNDRMLENRTLCREGLDRLAREERELKGESSQLHAEERTALDRCDAATKQIGERLAGVANAEDRAIRDRLEQLAARETKYAQATDAARNNYMNSKAQYEAYAEASGDGLDEERARARRNVKAAFSVALPLIFVLAGVPLFMYGRHLNSLSYTILGLVLVGFAIVVAAAALVIMLRPDRNGDLEQSRIKDSQWVMLQDAKKLEACEADEAAFAASVAEELTGMGLGDARGDVRRARAILDEAKDVRSSIALEEQRAQAARMRVNVIGDRLTAIAEERRRLCERAQVGTNADDEEMERAIDNCIQQKLGLQEASNSLNKRYGELSQELAQAKRANDFARLKTEHQEAITRTEEAKREFAKLVLARHMLEGALAAWESKSQPEVYAQASRLLALMTDGAWTSVFLDDDGSIKVADDARTVRDPLLLSLGTSQQLYLALRIALLMCATNVGSSIPILADDILVNFDAERRLGAARALAELARSRQVILFTGHEEVVAALEAADSHVTVIDL